ncbi:MAG: coenzyme F420-0:L-glutamate ligase [Acidimicrobiaceae bacterium]|jgi:coenzyme F420-0:L-glutamate ligase/coenzyme F420-1:gamma-L-glutamate ligase|nr:coenzyme F420-0:L-glutamate ligase [Acidimicrobiaceae bacterium]|tara:strand:- start:26716 stop:27414 length:699 start_codon:yes stop_codon:yes gene_type:complete
MTRLEIIPLEGLPEIVPGDDVVEIIGLTGEIKSGDILIVTQKIISKAENQMVDIDPNDPLSHKPLVEKESVKILRRRGDLIISQTKHGFVCANAGIDLSNVEQGQAALLPDDSDRSARRLRDGLLGRFQLDVGIIISDTFGRPWRRGLTDVAIGSAGVLPILDLRGSPDTFGREMQVTEVALVDELASAAELVMGKSTGIPIAIVRGGDESWFGNGSVQDHIVRDPKEDLFR